MQDLKLIIVCGLPGSGKSTLAESISEKLKLPVFSVDPIESAILKGGIKRSFETGLAAYLAAETLAGEHLKLGYSVIIDAVSDVSEAKQMWRKLARKHSTKLVILECFCSDKNLHKQRLAARTRNLHGIPEVTWEDVGKRRQEYTEWQELVLKLDSAGNNRPANIRKAIDYINAA